eukprot:3114570-Alexandrium_andersonii.AAC.1
MSASLVGSEMCIRDRLCTGEGSPLGTRSRGRRVHDPRKHHSTTQSKLRDCLLYTSDAADDM